MKRNKTLMQAFYWEMKEGEYKENFPEEDNLWRLLKKQAGELAKIGITELWIPPANKGHAGVYDVGYGSYDLWDLGEFEQKGTRRTKYGSREELEEAVEVLHNVGIRVYYDAVMNHMMGADELEVVPLDESSLSNPGGEAEVWTKFNYPGRKGKYDSFSWNWEHFNGTDWTENLGGGLYLFKDKEWDNTYCWEDDYLMGVDYDYLNPEVQKQMKKWGKWIINQIGFDGFRLDAVRHIDVNFMNGWIEELQFDTEKEVTFIGEAWFEDLDEIRGYLRVLDNLQMKVFDFPLRSAFKSLRDGNLDMRWLGGEGLVNQQGYEDRAVTFVDNHDTDRDSGGYGINSIYNRKYQAYTYILTREHGLPTVFWKDYYQYGMKEGLDKLIEVRRDFAYGKGYESYSNDFNTYSYVREGVEEIEGSGLVMMITQDNSGGIIEKRIDSKKPNSRFYDYTGNVEGIVETDAEGYGEFKIRGNESKGWSVWVPVN
ncbi:alpha-amylase [Halonatronum saccharophilum]|uniref:alpha-amylase n=1 Tax=Halonatronum saccharophilum TaxID=150060 RepID=UPI0004B3B8AF|nr:alpha-amylase [Halonatronum saccharophilum]